MTEMKVFISSTHEDLREYRQAAIDVVIRYKCFPLAMEHFDAKPQEPIQVCEKEIRECDVFLGIYAHRYGFIPKGNNKSITQLEYELAKKLNKDCLCFIVKDDFFWNPKLIEIKKYAKLKAFLKIVKEQQTVSFFEGVKDFESQFATSLGELRESKRGVSEVGQGKTKGQVCTPILIAPTPFIAHSYPLPEHFTGRNAERALFSHWLLNEKQSVLVLDGIGGMGKTALVWVWLHKEVLDRGLEFSGVFWWSFYESPFEVFILKLACYLRGMEDCGDTRSNVDMVDLQAALHKGKFLLVLDGLERELCGYSGMNAAYARDDGAQDGCNFSIEGENRQRVLVHPEATRFLEHLASDAGKTKTIITTRLMPLPLEGLAGVKRVCLTGLNPDDAVYFLRVEGVTGFRPELEQAAKVYENHPLMLKLLASAVKRSRSKDIRDADSKRLIDREEPRKILTTMYNLLTDEERRVAAVISVNRGTFYFELARALLPDLEENTLWQVLMELSDLGFAYYEEKHDRFDFHPILRSFLYDRLTDREEIHIRAVQYFQALHQAKKVVSLEDIAPVIELYYHLVKAGKYVYAFSLFENRIYRPLYYQLSAFQIITELLGELLSNGEDGLPRLKDTTAQAWALAALANTYSMFGQPVKSVPFHLLHNKLKENNSDIANLSIGLGSVAYNQIQIGQLSAAAAHLQKRIALGQEIKNEAREALGHQEWGRVLIFQGKINNTSPCANSELAILNAYGKKENNDHYLSINSAYFSLANLLKGRLMSLTMRQKKQVSNYYKVALEQALNALDFAANYSMNRYPRPRDFIQAYILLGEALIHCRLLKTDACKTYAIHFFDENFQRPTETRAIEPGNECAAAELCLFEALVRCRKANLVELEPSISLSLARLKGARISTQSQNNLKYNLTPLESFLSEALEIAQRGGFRLNLADIHLFAGQFLVQNKKLLKRKTTILGLDAREHLQKAKEFALDVSEFSDLYQSSDPDFYKDISEYEMLKRGMTQEERIKNGYYVAYQCAEALLKSI